MKLFILFIQIQSTLQTGLLHPPAWTKFAIYDAWSFRNHYCVARSFPRLDEVSEITTCRRRRPFAQQETTNPGSDAASNQKALSSDYWSEVETVFSSLYRMGNLHWSSYRTRRDEIGKRTSI